MNKALLMFLLWADAMEYEPGLTIAGMVDSRARKQIAMGGCDDYVRRPDDMLNFKLEDYTSEMHKLQTTNFDRLSKELVSSARAMRKSSMSCT
ncbi:hypothetical protein WJX74_001817 [Apatococcus lobatus]|uniref:Uncharacterized protein n=1 Tax=Apatococcus lobatus TaxID=904363 RepID=A0AAW1R269_9CHLO